MISFADDPLVVTVAPANEHVALYGVSDDRGLILTAARQFLWVPLDWITVVVDESEPVVTD